MSKMPQLISIQVGQPKTRTYKRPSDGKPISWTSGIFKTPIAGAVRVRTLGLDGDGQADLVNHGGADKAVLAYSADHFPVWRERLEILDITNGAFGENLTFQNLTEADVCIGDVWKLGDVILEVSQPREPCWKLGRRWNCATLPKQVVSTGWSGWYFRILEEGTIEAGCAAQLQERRHAEWSILRANQVRFNKQASKEELRSLAILNELSESWKQPLLKRAEISK